MVSEQGFYRQILTLMTRTNRFVSRWAPALVWLTFPLTAGSAFANALSSHSATVQLTAAIGLWVFWLAGLVAALVPSTVSLTTLRVLAPASLVAAAWAALDVSNGTDIASSVALGMTALMTVLSLSAGVGYTFINGSSYGDERRLPLRPPAPVIMGPLEIVWLLMLSTTFAGPLLVATHQYVIGALVTALAIAIDVAGARILHQLSKRWLVFVPAGIVVVDRTTLLDAMLVQRQRILSIGPSPADSSATDLTANALGVAIEIQLTEPTTIIPTPPRRQRKMTIEPVEVSAVRFTPTRPGWVLDTARERRINVE